MWKPQSRSRDDQELVRLTRVAAHEFRHEELGGVLFVPLVGVQGWADPAILDAYEAERLPITEQVSRFAMDMAGKVLGQRRTVDRPHPVRPRRNRRGAPETR